MKCIVNFKPVVAIFLSATLLTGFVAGVEKASADSAQASPAPIVIQSVLGQGEGATAELVVVTSVPATYTSYKASSPHRLVVDFSQAIPAESLSNLNFTKGAVKSVTLKRFDTDAGVLTRLEIFLSQDIEPVITPSTGKASELRISFPGYKPVVVEASSKEEPSKAEVTQKVDQVEPASATEQQKVESSKDVAPAAPIINNVTMISDVRVRGDIIEIISNNPIGEYKTFRLNKPERVVVDLLNVKVSMTNKLIQLNVSGVSTARVGSTPEKGRVVFDSINGVLPEATFTKTDAGLAVQFGTLDAKKAVETPAQAPQTDKLVAQPVVPAKPAVTNMDSALKTVTQVAAIDFQVVDDVSRVIIKLKGPVAVEPPVKSSGVISFKLKNAQLPRNLQRSLETREFVSTVLRVTPVQVKTKNSTDVLIRVTLKADSFFELRPEADVVYLDIKHPSVIKKTTDQAKVSATQKASRGPQPASNEQNLVQSVVSINDKEKKTKVYSGRRVSLEFADAEVRSIFQLLSEVSGKNFVLGDEIGGKISLKLVNVPWDQAFDIILTTKGFESQEQDNVLIVRGAGKLKSELDSVAEKRAAQLKSGRMVTRKFAINYSNSEDVAAVLKPLVRYEWQGSVTSDKRTNTVIVNAVEQLIGDMEELVKSIDIPEKQVMIEARIIEASTDFTRSLGVSWGLGTSSSSAGAGREWPFINSASSVFGGIASTPGTSTIGSATGAADITFGTIGANVKLSMRLNAAAKVGLIKIVSSPKVATLNNKTAKITQGKQIPYISSTSDKVETKFVEAALSLEVTPHINNNGTISLKIDAKNDSPDTTSTSATPPINKKQATTEMLLRDGETTIIGGIFVDSDTEGQEGIPWLMDVPILGNLFKSTSTTKNKSELLIFITPRILNSLI